MDHIIFENCALWSHLHTDANSITGVIHGNIEKPQYRRREIMIECLKLLGRGIQIVVKKAPRKHATGHTNVVFA